MSDVERPRFTTLTSGSELLIVTNWSDFEDLLPDQHWITARLDELEAIEERNRALERTR